jgi:hypothetical protein
MVTPRVGGGDGSEDNPCWVGGSNITPRAGPLSTYAYQLGDFRSAEKIEKSCTSGLPEEWRLGLPDESSCTVNLSQWTRELTSCIEKHGMDTVFRIYDPTKPVQEIYILKEWGTVTEDQVKEWVRTLTIDGVKEDANKRKPVCPFDEGNLLWSGEMVKNSISMKLWHDISSFLSGATGPEIYIAIVKRKHYTSANACRNLVEKLKTLHLNKEPGMNCTNFSKKLIDIIDQLKTVAINSYLQISLP